MGEKRLSSIEKRGWIIVTDFSNLPKPVKTKVSEKVYFCPKTIHEKVKLWRDIEKLVWSYAKRLGLQYNIEVEDIIQESYLFYEELITKFYPLYNRPMREDDSPEDAIKKCRVYTYDPNMAWKFYRIKPYLFKNLYFKIRWYAQKGYTYKTRLFGNEPEDSEDQNAFFDSVIHHMSETQSFLEHSYDSVDRKLIEESLHRVLDEVLLSTDEIKNKIGVLYFKDHNAENDIAKLVNRPISFVSNELRVIKGKLQSHNKIISLLSEFKMSGVSADEIFC